MYDIAFVILNYNLYNEVLQCVSSIEENIDTANYFVVVVDNASPNAVGSKLLKHYRSNNHVEVMINKENIGFAQGNNVGIDYIKNIKDGAKYICCLNNDVILEQRNIYETINRIFEYDSSISVIGPRIFNKYYEEIIQEENLRTISEYEQLIESHEKELSRIEKERIILSDNPWKKRLLENKYIYDINFVRRNLEKKIKQNINRNRNKKEYYIRLRDSYNREDINGKYDVILHGCCLFFTPAFFKYKKGFNESTFMYGEEPILFYEVIRTHNHTFRTDELNVIHIENRSTDSRFDPEEGRRFKLKNEMDSMRILIKILSDK